MHEGKQVQASLAPASPLPSPSDARPLFVDESGWSSRLQHSPTRKRLAIADFKDKQRLAEKLRPFIAQWNGERASP